jgi:Fur family transcriptional regulator, peroxide stress response regulator
MRLGHATGGRDLSGNQPERSTRATIYNNLHALIRAGLIREVAVGGKAVRFDANVGRHHHFVCERCGRVEDIEWFDLPSLARRPALGPRIVRNYQVVFREICERCSEPFARD